PRPERPEFVKTLSEQIPYYRQRHCVRPGITGWAQINYKYGETTEDTITKLEYDLYYIKNMSWSLDTYVIFHTLKAMVMSKGSQSVGLAACPRPGGLSCQAHGTMRRELSASSSCVGCNARSGKIEEILSRSVGAGRDRASEFSISGRLVPVW